MYSEDCRHSSSPSFLPSFLSFFLLFSSSPSFSLTLSFCYPTVFTGYWNLGSIVGLSVFFACNRLCPRLMTAPNFMSPVLELFPCYTTKGK